MVTHHPDSGLMTVSKHGQHKISVEEVGGGMDAESIREELCLSNEKKLLLLFMWVTDEELQLLKMHPECISFDVTS